MGMHIWYGLALGEEATFDVASAKITELHRYAQTVGFLGRAEFPPVGDIESGDGTVEWAPTFHIERDLGNRQKQFISVPALEWVGFVTMPGKGTETARFGLARYPKIFRPAGKQSQIISVTRQNFDGSVESDLSAPAEPADEVVTGSTISCTAIWRSSSCSITPRKSASSTTCATTAAIGKPGRRMS